MTPVEVLKKYWGFSSFRPVQEDIINSIIAGKDTLALLPTGGGKSICYQVPAIILKGTALVISPLIALMQDQVMLLEKKGIKAIALHSGMHYTQIQLELENAANGRYQLLYVSPERLLSLEFRTWLKSIDLNFIAVDEAHCISQWGHDFRPAYRKIAKLREEFNVPCIALTASATPKVKEDIVKQLELKNAQVYFKSFVRSNLSFSNFNTENKQGKILDILQKTSGSSIVYARNRGKCKELSSLLTNKGISSTYYHGGLNPQEREEKQSNWINNKVRCIVCTNAFGMGIDKPDVRFVIHDAPPENLEAYYQEAGRAGRDGEKAYGVMLFNQRDIDLSEKLFHLKFPNEKIIHNTANALYNYYQIAAGSGLGISKQFSINAFSDTYKLDYYQTHQTLKLLSILEMIHLTEAVHSPASFKVICNYKELYNYRLKNEKINRLFDIILRIKQDVFDSYNSISLDFIAKKLRLQEEQVKRQFFHLHQQEIIDFKPATDQPILTFIVDRPQQIKFKLDTIEKLKIRQSKKWEKVKSYLSNSNRCRMNELVAYFGEKNSDDCGLCDVCILKRKNQEKKLRLSKAKNKIKDILNKKEMSSNDILSNFSSTEVIFAQEALRILLDEGILAKIKGTEKLCLAKEK